MSERPQGAKLLVMLERKEGEAVIVYTSDRLSRNLAHSLILREDWQRARVELHFVDRGKTENTAEGRLMQNVESVIAEYEREKIRERTKRGKFAKAKAGKLCVGGLSPYGYKYAGKGREAVLCIDDHEAAVVRRIFSMYLGLNGCHATPMIAIARILTAEGVPSPRNEGKGWYIETVRRIIKRRAYIGEFTWNGHTIHAPELAMIDTEIFEAAQKRIRQNAELSKRNRRHARLLAGHFRCECGIAMVGRSGRGYYQCNNTTHNKKYLTHCAQKRVSDEEVEGLVWAWVSGLLCDQTNLAKGLREMREHKDNELLPRRERLANVNTLITKAEQSIARLVAAMARAEDDSIAAVLESQAKQAGKERTALIAERDMLTREIAGLDFTDEQSEAILAMADRIHRRLGADPTFEQKRELLRLLDLRVILRHNASGGRELYVTCGLRAEGETLAIETRIL
jgi:site-specific DNA recombinase